MIKARMRNAAGNPAYFFGLSRENVEQLIAGNDIDIDGRLVGIEGRVIISFGETEAAISQRLGMPAIQPKSGQEFRFDPVTGMREHKRPGGS